MCCADLYKQLIHSGPLFRTYAILTLNRTADLRNSGPVPANFIVTEDEPHCAAADKVMHEHWPNLVMSASLIGGDDFTVSE